MKNQTKTSADMTRAKKNRSALRNFAPPFIGEKEELLQQATGTPTIVPQNVVPDDAAILENCQRYGQDYFNGHFLNDILARVKRNWDTIDSQKGTGGDTAIRPSHKPIDQSVLDLLLRIYHQYSKEFTASSNTEVKKIANVFTVVTVNSGYQDKSIQSGFQLYILQEYISPHFAQLLYQNNLAQPEQSDTFKTESLLKDTMEKDFSEKIPPGQEEVAPDLVAENTALIEEIKNLRRQLEDAQHRIKVFEATVSELRGQIQMFLQSERPEVAEQQEDLPEEIINALKTWPGGRRTLAGSGRLENPEAFVSRIFAEYYRKEGGYDPLRHPRLRTANLVNLKINPQLYSALLKYNQRHGITANCISIRRSSDQIDQEIEIADKIGYDKIPFRKASRLISAKYRRPKKAPLPSNSS